LWPDLPALNAYIARCQSFLQRGSSDEDVLLYHPIHDLWSQEQGVKDGLIFATVHNADGWLNNTPFGQAGKQLIEMGVGFDYVSDRLLAKAPGDKPIIVPRCERIPVDTFKRLLEIVRDGGTVAFLGNIPKDVPGLVHVEERRKELAELSSEIKLQPAPLPEVSLAILGKGRIIVGNDLATIAAVAGARHELILGKGLSSIRRKMDDGHAYFIVNTGDQRFDGWVTLATPFTSAVLFDPMSGRSGVAATVTGPGMGYHAYLQLDPGESCILRTLSDRAATGDDAPYLSVRSSAAQEISGKWRVQFTSGGPSLPKPFDTRALGSWTGRGDDQADVFCGTARYSITFDLPKSAQADEWLLDLGQVAESAKVTINGQFAGTTFFPPFVLRVGPLLKSGENTLEVDVSNLAANRIRDLDRRGVQWRSFYEINFVNIDYKSFDASSWPVMPSGLLGPVKLIPCAAFHPQ
jgi:hypothetical protein